MLMYNIVSYDTNTSPVKPIWKNPGDNKPTCVGCSGEEKRREAERTNLAVEIEKQKNGGIGSWTNYFLHYQKRQQCKLQINDILSYLTIH